MSKQIRPNELAEIVTGLLVRPDLLNAFEGSSQVQEEFIEAIGQVVTDYCGGRVNCVHPADIPMDSKPCLVETPFLSVWPSQDLPSLKGCVWALYDPAGWEDEVPGACGLEDGIDRSKAEIAAVRSRLQGLLVEAVKAQNEVSRIEYIASNGYHPTAKHTLVSFEDGAQYIDALAEANMVYHFDDGAADCLSSFALTEDQIEAIEHNVAQLREIDWSSGGYECLFHYALKATGNASDDEHTAAAPINTSVVESPSPFKVVEAGERNRCHIEIHGLGAVHLNRTHEGLIIDVWPAAGGVSLGTIALQDDDFPAGAEEE